MPPCAEAPISFCIPRKSGKVRRLTRQIWRGDFLAISKKFEVSGGFVFVRGVEACQFLLGIQIKFRHRLVNLRQQHLHPLEQSQKNSRSVSEPETATSSST
ncbi:hypothetical protein QE152_g36126 [Popillia japonica]|uniref:Uncharacterized protein n=1 Tax=Popillia japonica TaxID=7064 RepID=A0AAW1IE63_POPJA